MNIQTRNAVIRLFVLSFTIVALIVAAPALAAEAAGVELAATGEPVASAEPVATIDLSVAAAADEVGPPKPVVVVNSPSAPVPVTGDVNVVNPVSVIDAVRQPVHILRNFNLQDGDQGNFADLFTVPDGKQFVLTQASVALTESSATSFRIDVATGTGFLAIYDFAGVRSGPLANGGANSWSATLLMNLYVDAGQLVDCAAFRESASGVANGRCSISGYLVDAPESSAVSLGGVAVR